MNNSECTSFAFRVYATYEVDSRLSDTKIHAIIDKLNPELRSIDTFNGKKRVREFYAMSAEDAYLILEAIAEIHNFTDRLKLWEPTHEEAKDEEVAKEIERKKQERCSNYTFSEWGIPIGAKIEHINNPDISFTVISDRKLEYNGEAMYMTSFAKLISGKSYITNGPGYVAKHFKYMDELIEDIEERLRKNS